MSTANLVGKLFGRLTVVSYSRRQTYTTSKQVVHYWKCSCICGTEVEANGNSLKSGTRKSCGCLRREQANINRNKNPRNNKGLSKTKEYKLWDSAKQRSRKYGRELDIGVDDIHIPEFCPVLGFRLNRNSEKLGFDSPTLDRIDNTKGYIKGNVAVISQRANSLKQDSTIADLEKLIAYMKKEIKNE